MKAWQCGKTHMDLRTAFDEAGSRHIAKIMEGHDTHGWIIPALLREMTDLGGTRKVRVCGEQVLIRSMSWPRQRRRSQIGKSVKHGCPLLLMSEPWEVHEWEELVQHVSGQYLPSWTQPNVWVELSFQGYEEWYNDCEDWVCVPIFDKSTGEWDIRSGFAGIVVRAECWMAWPKKRTRPSAPGRVLEKRHLSLLHSRQ